MAAPADEPGAALLALYDRALPAVYGYLLPRCGAASLAEDLTSETFLAAVDAVRRGDAPAVSTPWLVGVARHKLADHWRPAGAAPSRTALSAPGHGALTYITMRVADTAQARAFYRAVFGWDFTAGNWPDGWNVLEPLPMTGMAGGHGRPGHLPVYQVDDVEAAARRARDAGGTASAPDRRPYGTMSDCASPDGVVFSLWQP